MTMMPGFLVHGLLVCVACLLVAMPRIAPALGLGAIETRSAQNGPLDVRIPLSRIRGGDLEGMRVALGSPAQFELAGVARLPVLESLEFSVVEQDDGGGYIHVHTDEPITASSLTFLIEVDWPRGRTVRGYRLLLAPASAGSATGASVGGQAEREAEAVASVSTDVGATGADAPASTDSDATDADAPASTPAAPSASSGADYGPVRAHDTLWSIAARFRPDTSVSVQRMMLAFLEANPGAFAIRNVNALNAGVTLRIPSRDEIGPDDRKAAIAEVKRQQAAWTEYRKGRRAAPAVPAAPATPPSDAETPPGDTAPPLPGGEPEPEGRIEAVSPETAPGAAVDVPDREEDSEIHSLRNELARAVEEAAASLRENEALKLRLVEVEDQLKELTHLVGLMSEEIAALREELQSRPPPQPAPAPAAAPEPAPSDVESRPAQAQSDAGSAPSPEPAETEPKSMPFGLDALPINPVFLVGGAGLILILLGGLALLRRRASAARDDEGFDPAEPPPPAAEDNLLHELEAVAADLADKPADPPDDGSRTAPPADSAEGVEIGTVKGGAERSGTDGLADERMTERPEDRPEAGRPGPADPEAHAGGSDPAFDLDALAREESDSGAADGRTGDDRDRGDLDKGDPDKGNLDKGNLDRDDPDRDDAGSFSLEGFGDDEAQTKLDLAQVYLEMGHAESAREFLEAVLTEGNTSQREAARDMLSKLD